MFPISEASILVNLNMYRTPQVSSNKAAEDIVVGFGTVDLFSLTVDTSTGEDDVKRVNQNKQLLELTIRLFANE